MSEGGAGLGVLLAGLAACGGRAAPAAGELPDVVLVTIDTLRADHLGTYGYFRETSPVIDGLARESIVFERCLAPMATTLPTHVSLFTSTFPIEHGVLANGRHGGERFVPSEQLVPFASYLRDLGYATAAFVSALPLRHTFGLGTGFGAYNMPKATQRKAHVTTGYALQWLEEQGPGPLFLWVHLFDPHFPYDAPGQGPHYASDRALGEYLAARRFSEQAARPTGQINHAAEGVNTYDREVAFTDLQVGRLVAGLKASGRWEDCVFVLLGDHGEGLNQHGEPGHGLVWDEQLHVPALMRVPGEPPRRVRPTLSVVDLLPTLLGRVELPREGVFLEQASGRDVLAAGFEARPVFAQTSPRQGQYGEVAAHALTTGEWKLISREDGTLALFDLRGDPFELEDVASLHPETTERLRAALERELERQRARARELGSGRTVELTSEEQQGLRSLGYGGDDDE